MNKNEKEGVNNRNYRNGGEDTGQHPRDQGHHDKGGAGDRHGDGQQPLEGLPDPPVVLGPIVVAHNGLDPLGDALGGQDRKSVV